VLHDWKQLSQEIKPECQKPGKENRSNLKTVSQTGSKEMVLSKNRELGSATFSQHLEESVLRSKIKRKRDRQRERERVQDSQSCQSLSL
jgi:hypothetical protein